MTESNVAHLPTPPLTDHDRFEKAVDEAADAITKRAGVTYDPSMCEKVRLLMSEGHSGVAAAKELGCHPRTFIRWQTEHPELRAAVEAGREASQAWWEELGRRGAIGATKINPAVWIFTMKNRFGWADNRKIEDSRATKKSIRAAIQEAERAREK